MTKCWLLLLVFLLRARRYVVPPDDLRALRGFAGASTVGTLLRAAWSGASCCGWEGVGCDGDNGRVTVLRLPGYGLAGPIPGASLASLSQLEELFLGFNSFTGSIPEALYSLAGLRKLSLESNELIGS
ncbi:hypothetical protein ZWY2020_006778 [Hordeum vulgare]|nr:hypothetical protein ZWY2020_006778 [Hordeum vulgare]